MKKMFLEDISGKSNYKVVRYVKFIKV